MKVFLSLLRAEGSFVEFGRVSIVLANQVRLWLFVLAHNLANFLRRLGLPDAIKNWSLRRVQIKLIKIGPRLVRHARRLVFRLAEVAVPRALFQGVLERICNRLW